MARIRSLKPDFFLNERLAKLPPHARLLFAGLWTHADREGRLEDRPARIKANLFPYEDGVDVDALLDVLNEPDPTGDEKPFILRYVVDGRRVVMVTEFGKHQKPHIRELPSTLPAPPPEAYFPGPKPGGGEQKRGLTQPEPGSAPTRAPPKPDQPGTQDKTSESQVAEIKPGSAPTQHLPGRAVYGLGSGLGSGSGSGLGDGLPKPASPAAQPEERAPDPGPVVEYLRREFPAVEEPDNAVRTWLESYPYVNVLEQLRSAKAQLVSNPGKKYEVIAAYLNKWLRSENQKNCQLAADREAHPEGSADDPPVQHPDHAATKRYLGDRAELDAQVEREREEGRRKGKASPAARALQQVTGHAKATGQK